MNQQNRLEIVTQQGWRKEYPITKGIIHIGSAATNDIVLGERFGGGVAPLHVQLITTSNGHTVYKLINLSETDIPVGGETECTLAPRSVLDLTDGLRFKLGEFTLVFRGTGQDETASTRSSRSIGLKLELPGTQLAPNQSLEGVVTVSNLGQRVGARFDLALDGMEPGCFDIAPGPLLSSGAEKEVLFRLHHRGQKPVAGKRRIVIRTSAPDSYPGEQATVSQIIEVLPFYHHRMTLTPAKGITIHRPETTPTTMLPPKTAPATPASTTEGDWNIPAENRSSPTLVVKAGTAALSQPASPNLVAETWWSEPTETMPPQIQTTPSPETDALWSAPETTVISPETAHAEHTEAAATQIEPAPDSDVTGAAPAPIAEAARLETPEPDIAPTGPESKLSIQPVQPEHQVEANLQGDEQPKAVPSAGTEVWANEIENETLSRTKPAQKIKITAPVPQSVPIVSDEEKDWWGNP